MTKENKNTLAIKGEKRRHCRHDHKNAIQVGNVDYMCPWCKELIDPMEWFLMNSFTFVDERVEKSQNK